MLKGWSFRNISRETTPVIRLNPTTVLPDELLMEIFTLLLDETVYGTLPLVSKRFNSLSNDDLLWRYFCKMSFPHLKAPVGLKSWRKFYVDSQLHEWRVARARETTIVQKLKDGLMDRWTGLKSRLLGEQQMVISGPTSCTHTMHIGFDANGFQTRGIPEEWRVGLASNSDEEEEPLERVEDAIKIETEDRLDFDAMSTAEDMSMSLDDSDSDSVSMFGDEEDIKSIEDMHTRTEELTTVSMPAPPLPPTAMTNVSEDETDDDDW